MNNEIAWKKLILAFKYFFTSCWLVQLWGAQDERIQVSAYQRMGDEEGPGGGEGPGRGGAGEGRGGAREGRDLGGDRA